MLFLVPSPPSTPLVVGLLSANAYSVLWQEAHDISLVLDSLTSSNSNLPSRTLSSVGRLSSGYSISGSLSGKSFRKLCLSLLLISGWVDFSEHANNKDRISNNMYLFFDKFCRFYNAAIVQYSKEVCTNRKIYYFYYTTID